MTRYLPVLALCACSPTLYVHTPDPAQATEHRTVIRDAGRKIGIRIKVTDTPGPNSVEVTFRPPDEGVCGAALEKVAGFPEHPVEVSKAIYEHVLAGDLRAAAEAAIDCSPRAWSCVSPDALAHELGHILGLPHKAGTAMDPVVSPEPFTERQKLIARGVAIGFAELCQPVEGSVSDPLEPSE